MEVGTASPVPSLGVVALSPLAFAEHQIIVGSVVRHASCVVGGVWCVVPIGLRCCMLLLRQPSHSFSCPSEW